MEDKHSMSENPNTVYINCGITMALQKAPDKAGLLEAKSRYNPNTPTLWKKNKSWTNFSNRANCIHDD